MGRRQRVSRRHHERALGEPLRRRRLLGVRRIRPIRTRVYCEVAGRLHRPRRSHDAGGARHPAEGRLRREAALQLEHADRASARRRRARSTSARSSCSARAITATRWERISPDLTTNDPEKQKQEQSGGVTVDNSAAEMHTTIYSISESPKNANVIWVGTDDGNLQLTRDGGKTWTNVVGNVPGLPKGSWVSWVEASRFDAGDRVRGVRPPHVRRHDAVGLPTTDFGKTWTRIVATERRARLRARDQGGHGQAEPPVPRHRVRPVDLGRRRRARGREFKGGDFPAVAVRELAGPAARQRPRDRDARPRHLDHRRPHAAARADRDDARRSRPRSCRRVRCSSGCRPAAAGSRATRRSSATTRRTGASITYYLRTRHVYGPIKLEVLDAAGKLVDTITPSKRRGINRVVWTMRVKPPRVPRAAQVAFGSSQGPRVVPGTYTVRLTRGSDVDRDQARDRARPARAVQRRRPQGAVRRGDEGARRCSAT